MPAHGHRLCPPGASLHRPSAHASLHRQSAHARLHQQPAPAASPQLISPGPLQAGHSSLSPSSGPAHSPVTVPVPLLFRAFPWHRAELFSTFTPFFRSCPSVQSGLNWLRGWLVSCSVLSAHIAGHAARCPEALPVDGPSRPCNGQAGAAGALIMRLMGLNLFYACQRPASGAALSLQCVTCCAVLFCANVAGGLCSREYY